MRCPFCHKDNDRVLDTRASEDGYVTRRRRECLACHRRFTTYERLDEMTIRVIKKDGAREPFQPEKLRAGLAKACWKRPVSGEQIDAIVAAIEDELYSDLDREVPSRLLGEMAMQQLAKIDQVAFVRFASVYREFKDVRDFMDEVAPMLRHHESHSSS